MINTRKFFDAILDLSIEGIRYDQICTVTNLSKDEVLEIIEQYSGLLYIETIGQIELIKLKRPRSLKTAYTFYKISNTTTLNFPWTNLEYDFFHELADPKYRNRIIDTLPRLLNVKHKIVNNMITKFQNQGIICKRGSRVSFTMIGFPIWATLVIGRIFIMNK